MLSSNKTNRWCKKNFEHFIPKKRWPPNSPDLNPMDYYYWSAIVTRMRHTRLKTRDDLISEIKRAAKLVPISEIRSAVSKFNCRVRAVEKAGGGHIHSKFS